MRPLRELGLQLGAQGEKRRGALAALKKDDQHQDLTTLAGDKPGWDARLVAMKSLASEFSVQSKIHPEFYYALFRVGVPANEMALNQMSPSAVKKIWEQAVERKVISAELKEKIPNALGNFKACSIDRLLEEFAQVGASSFVELIRNALIKYVSNDPDEQKRFAKLHTTRQKLNGA